MHAGQRRELAALAAQQQVAAADYCAAWHGEAPGRR